VNVKVIIAICYKHYSLTSPHVARGLWARQMASGVWAKRAAAGLPRADASLLSGEPRDLFGACKPGCRFNMPPFSSGENPATCSALTRRASPQGGWVVSKKCCKIERLHQHFDTELQEPSKRPLDGPAWKVLHNSLQIKMLCSRFDNSRRPTPHRHARCVRTWSHHAHAADGAATLRADVVLATVTGPRGL
jgi:hypothetical protein